MTDIQQDGGYIPLHQFVALFYPALRAVNEKHKNIESIMWCDESTGLVNVKFLNRQTGNAKTIELVNENELCTKPWKQYVGDKLKNEFVKFAKAK